jgi:hypothetical protein
MPGPIPAPASPTSSPGSPASPGGPVGVSPVTQSTPNRGLEMAGMQGLGTVLKQLEMLVPRLGATSEAGADVLKCIKMLSKHARPGSVSPAGERNELMQQMQRMQRGMQQMPKPGGPAPGGAPQGAPSPAPAPQPQAA